MGEIRPKKATMICDVSHDKNLRVNQRILFFGGKQTKLMFKHRQSETAPIGAICLFNSRAFLESPVIVRNV